MLSVVLQGCRFLPREQTRCTTSFLQISRHFQIEEDFLAIERWSLLGEFHPERLRPPIICGTGIACHGKEGSAAQFDCYSRHSLGEKLSGARYRSSVGPSVLGSVSPSRALSRLVIRSVPKRRPKPIDKVILRLLQDLLVLLSGRNLPVVYLPPPLPHSGPKALSLELSASIPMPPAKHDQIPQYPLRKREENLIADGDERDFPIRIRVLDAREVGLLKAEVGNGRKSLLPGSRLDDLARYRRCRGLGVGGRIEGLRARTRRRGDAFHSAGDLFARGGGRVYVVRRGWVALDGDGLDCGGKFGGRIRGHLGEDREAEKGECQCRQCRQCGESRRKKYRVLRTRCTPRQS